ncbi:protein translocase subunit SecD [Nocardia asteroides NBRC 15531]|uniref:Protein translocase subunit SecD n=1 Tax=Nocardia asteroides NBRC 15531 TaxID=1110697 RepID=U5EDS4_NOCAS|nr:protein translocase subunit SecD [Nocardia asteroides]TLF64401.1 protein translocase subunit SecD [Nocardia asteroides NBRC 15531]UGT50490.1 protein translocase subunit SecD [Nocardia asteroides]SFN36575.1 preprotein translocase subunit SecD [Nocardia asteroides]VEG36702.1 preprotein translocase subunit SecD [Nocardia asteroides]GAD84556.1 protein-export membrane protein SecD [Nocardia asteroides NBRC 15531]
MPPSQGSAHPYRLLGVYAALLAVIYALVFFTGDHSPTPKLGIDLQGGTRVTLTARTPDGSRPSQDSLKKAQEIIENRVNGLGVSGSEVVIDGDNLVITVPGDDSQQARALATTAKLYIRPVLAATQPQAGGAAPQVPPAQGGGTPAPTTSAPAPATGETPAPAAEEETTPAPQSRVFPAQAPPTPTPAPGGGTTVQQQQAKEIADAKALRQSTDQSVQQVAMASMDCTKPDPLAGNDDPALPLVTCSQDGTEVFLLGPSRIDGQEIADATSGFNQQQSRHEVNLEFKSSGADAWQALTGEYVYKRIAFVLDSKVVSAPQVTEGPQLGGRTSISGSFTADSASELANTLKYGSLPLSFQTSEAETVSATLGLSSLKAGLLAGAIGLIAVLLYCLFVYRMLGLIAGFSLIAAGVAVYGIIVLLGRWIGFTLDLAGIAGLIIGIGLTADSFVVFFERIKDEMREGRSFRSAVPRGWARAQRTNLSGKTVSLIASVVLYLLAAGQVKGFAFTLGVTTVLDVIVLYLVTAPLMMIISRSPFWAKPSVNGLGSVQQIARERGAGQVRPKEMSR